MKVLIVTEVFPPRLGGDGIHVMELAHHLRKAGVGVSVLTKASEGREEFPFEVRRIGLKGNGLLGRVSFVVSSLFVRPEADVVHAHAAVGGIIGLFYKRFYKTPVVVTVHTIWGASLSSTRAKGVGAFLQWSEKAIFTSGFDHYVTVTREIADRLREWGLKRISFIPNGVNRERFCPPKNKAAVRKSLGLGKGKVVLFVGRLVGQKNVGLLLESFRLFLDKNPGAKLLLAGSGPEEEGLRRKARQLGLGKSAVFLGAVGYEKLPAYYQASDCFVLTSKWEGLPLCVLEALSVGIPVVSTRVGGVGEAIKNGYNGYLADGDAEDVSNKLSLATGRGRVRMGKNAEKTSRRYGWESISGQVRAIYMKIISESR